MAAALDQFGQPLASQPPITWTLLSGPGLLSSAGLYTPPYAGGSAVVQAASGGQIATATVTFSSEAQWNADTQGVSTGSWTTSGDWLDAFTGTALAAPGVRGLAGDTVLIASAAVARLDGASPTLAGVIFNNAAAGYGIIQGSGGSLTLQTGYPLAGGGATVSVLAGSPAINAPVHLAGNTVFSAAASTTLTMTGPIDGDGSLTMTGGGGLFLSGSNDYSGGTSVSSGTLIVASPSALPVNSALVVRGGAFLFDPSAAASTVSPAATTTVASITVTGATVGSTPTLWSSIVNIASAANIAAPVAAGLRPAPAQALANVFAGADHPVPALILDSVVTKKPAAAGNSIAAVHDAAIREATIQPYARRLAWLEGWWNSFSSGSQGNNHTPSIQALDAVMAKYRQQ